MGVNNKQRRAAKKRKQRRSHPSGGFQRPGFDAGPWGDPAGLFDDSDPFTDPPFWADRQGEPEWADPYDDPAWVANEMRALLVSVIAEVAAEPARAGDLAARLPVDPQVARLLAEQIAGLCAELLTRATGNGWSPADLGEIVRRRGSARQLPVLAHLLSEETAKQPHARVPGAWTEELAALGTPRAADPAARGGMEIMLGLAAALLELPAIPEVTPGLGSTPAADSVPVDGEHATALRRVRSLLAKAESTEFDEEAEALSAKAQELITRHALDRLLERADTGASTGTGSAAVRNRRIWLDAPYLTAKAILVQTVAEANRCRSVLAKDLGVCT
ncbi:MAG: DUF2786 domain-containing protein, partial [Nocardioidaceae bacterium]